jgi:hypothetical protein
MRKKSNIILVILCCVASAHAQSGLSGNKKVLFLGESMATYVHDSTQSQLRDVRFHLLPLVEVTERAMLITEIGVETYLGSPVLKLEQVQLCYDILPDVTFYAGRFFPKFGSYRARYGAAFINRMTTDPVGFGENGIGAMTETGIGFVGGLQLGMSKLSYDVYLSNGPQLITEGTSAGRFEYESYLTNNKDKAVGGRIGLLPFSNSSLELGFSMQAKNHTGALHSEYEHVNNLMYAVDLDCVKRFRLIKSTVRLLCEYKAVQAGNAYYRNPFDSSLYTFNNASNAWYGQVSIRPTDAENEFMSNLEFVFRYSEFDMPDGSKWETGDHHLWQAAGGINYFITWDTIIKLMYQRQSNTGEMFSAQIVYRF